MGNSDPLKALPGWAAAGIYCAAIAVLFWQFRNPTLRFSLPLLNDLVGVALALALPWLAVYSLFRSGCIARGLAYVLGFPLLFYSFVVIPFFSILAVNYEDGHNLGFERFVQKAWDGSEISLYRTNGGATTDFGVVIRQERVIFPGLLLVRNIDSLYPCESLDVKNIGEGVEIDDPSASCQDLSKNRRYSLKRFVYF